MKSKPQFILAMQNGGLISELQQGVNRIGFDQFVGLTQGLVTIREREHLEQDPNYRQVIPYVMLAVRDADGKALFVPYARTSQSGEERLRGNVSLGFGGHIDLADVIHNDSVIDLVQTIGGAVTRELQEEVSFSHAVGENFDMPMFDAGVLIDDSNDVGKVHLGVLLTCLLPEGTVVTSNEEALEILPLMNAQQLLASGLPLETWTRIILEDIIANSFEDEPNPEEVNEGESA